MPKQDLAFQIPVLNAAGMLGYAPDFRRHPQIHHLGGFITNPVSRLPRSPAESRTAARFPGGALIHTGFPNPGLKAVIRQHARSWQQPSIPVILHLMVEHAAGLDECLRMLDTVDGLSGLELSFSPGLTADEILECAELAAREWPVVIELDSRPGERLLPRLAGCDIAAVCSAPPRGVLPVNGESEKQLLSGGRIYGPGVFPPAMYWVQQAVCVGLPVIAAGGIYSWQEARQFLRAGALAVKLDTVLWSGGISFPAEWSRDHHLTA
jgi:dihydroorotate dehydrogenase (NAD+) catalytic subunit